MCGLYVCCKYHIELEYKEHMNWKILLANHSRTQKMLQIRFTENCWARPTSFLSWTLAEHLKRLRMRGGVNLNFIPWTRIRLRLGKVFIQQVTTRISPLSNTLWLPPVPKILSSVFTVSKYILRTRLLKCSCITHLHNALHFKKFNEIMFNFVNDKVWWLKVKSFVVLEWSFNGVPGGIF